MTGALRAKITSLKVSGIKEVMSVSKLLKLTTFMLVQNGENKSFSYNKRASFFSSIMPKNHLQS